MEAVYNLTHVWTDSLDRRSIIQRAFAINTSIDPSEDAGQMRLLLSSIQKALDGEPGTDIEFSSSKHGRRISIQLSTPLPASLPSLRWETSLQRCPQSTVTTKLIIPLLTDQLTAKAEKTSLLQQLKDKDIAISKMINQMQADGSDMSKVFPGTVSARFGNKANIRQTIGRSIKGVAEFDENLWQNRIFQEQSVPADLRELLSRVSPIAAAETFESFPMPDNDAWSDQKGQLEHAEKVVESKKKPSAHYEDEMDMDNKDDFQTQTPPFRSNDQPVPTSLVEPVRRSSSPLPTSNTSQDQANSTTDNSDNDLDFSGPKSVGSNDATPSNGARESMERINKSNERADLSSDRSSMDLDASPPPSFTRPLDDKVSQRQRPVTPKPKLGKIGGKKKVESPEIADRVDKASIVKKVKTSGSAAPAPKTQDESPDTSPLTKSTYRSRSKPPAKHPSPPRDTSQERANRNREKLKRELDIKTRAGTKKKPLSATFKATSTSTHLSTHRAHNRIAKASSGRNMTSNAPSGSNLRATAPEFMPGATVDATPMFPLDSTLQDIAYNPCDVTAYEHDLTSYNLSDLVFNAPNAPHPMTTRSMLQPDDLHITSSALACSTTDGKKTNKTGDETEDDMIEMLCRCNGQRRWILVKRSKVHKCLNTPVSGACDRENPLRQMDRSSTDGIRHVSVSAGKVITGWTATPIGPHVERFACPAQPLPRAAARHDSFLRGTRSSRRRFSGRERAVFSP
ncbi:MAG: hypothetical protein Q9217_000055 [Psora testacea]